MGRGLLFYWQTFTNFKYFLEIFLLSLVKTFNSIFWIFSLKIKIKSIIHPRSKILRFFFSHIQHGDSSSSDKLKKTSFYFHFFRKRARNSKIIKEENRGPVFWFALAGLSPFWQFRSEIFTLVVSGLFPGLSHGICHRNFQKYRFKIRLGWRGWSMVFFLRRRKKEVSTREWGGEDAIKTDGNRRKPTIIDEVSFPKIIE